VRGDEGQTKFVLTGNLKHISFILFLLLPCTWKQP